MKEMNRDKAIAQDNTAIVLGGTVPHGELIQKLQRRGYYVILVDYLKNPPAAKYADLHSHKSAMDEDSVMRIARESHARLVISSCLDQQMNIAIKVSETLGLPHPFSSELVRCVTDKAEMKQRMKENDIPSSKFVVTRGMNNLDMRDMTFPMIVKPVDSSGSAGVTKAECITEIEPALDQALRISFSGTAIIEEFVDGTEMGIHGYIKDGKTFLLFATCKITEMRDGILQQLCNIYIPDLSRELQSRIEKTVDDIAKAFDFPACTPFVLQIIVRDGDISVIEFSPRVAGGVSSHVAEVYAGFDIINYSIDSYLGIRPVSGAGRLEQYVFNFPIYCGDGIFDKVVGNDILEKEGIIEETIYLKSQGDEISISKPSSSNVIKYIIKGSSWNECFEKLIIADKRTDILNVRGSSMRLGLSSLTAERIEKQLAGLCGSR